jgi:PAS domain S-box-containing protein
MARMDAPMDETQLDTRGGDGLEPTERLLRTERNFVTAVLDSSNALLVVLDLEGRILRFNRAAERAAGRSFLEAIGHVPDEFFPPADPASSLQPLLQRVRSGDSPVDGRSDWTDPTGRRRCTQWTVTACPGESGEPAYIICSGIDITPLREAEEERERLIGELKEALARIETLHGLIPICAGCKKIRDDRGYWHQVEAYIEARSRAEFSHGLCPDCIVRLYPEYADRINLPAADEPSGF